MRTRIYVSGPLSSSGERLNNVHRAIEVGRELIRLGYAPLVPHLTHYLDPDDSLGHQTWLAVDEPWVACSHALLRLPGESKGADFEVSVAKRHGIPVYYGIPQLVEEFPPGSHENIPGPCTYCGDPSHWRPDCPELGDFIKRNRTAENQQAVWEERQRNVEADRLQQALSGARGPDQQRIAAVGLRWLDTLLRKNADYGSSAWKSPVLSPSLDTGTAILVRMSDKVERIARLQAKAAEVPESLEDSVNDLGAYALLYLARPGGEE